MIKEERIEKLLKDFKEVNGDAFDYRWVTEFFVNQKEEIPIYCKKHGKWFNQKPDVHRRGSGCEECKRDKCRNATNKRNRSCDRYGHWKKQATEKHGDKYVLPTREEFKTQNDKYKFYCKEHDEEFVQVASKHLVGTGCKGCIDKMERGGLSENEYFLKKAEGVHEEGHYSFPDLDYKGANTTVMVHCNKHNYDFPTYPKHFWKGGGCPKCGKERSDAHKHSTHEKYIEGLKKSIDPKYDISNVEYKGSWQTIKMICPEHGPWTPLAHSIKNKGSGCPKCSSKVSEPEIEIYEFLKEHTEVIQSDKKQLEGKEIDLYIPEYNIGIEYNGLYWHSDKKKTNDYHISKTNKAKEKGIQLIHIFEDEWEHKKDIVKSRLLNLINKTPNKIYARETVIKRVSSKDSDQFLNSSHTQGSVRSKIKLGLYYKDELISLMTFGSLRKNLGQQNKEGHYELLRFCNKQDTVVIGAASKLFKYFIKNYSPINIISYADRRWSEGNLYKSLGFELRHLSEPNYFYVKSGHRKRENRFKYRKSELVKEGFDKEKTEKQIMKERGYYRIYDCGALKFEYKLQ